MDSSLDRESERLIKEARRPADWPSSVVCLLVCENAASVRTKWKRCWNWMREASEKQQMPLMPSSWQPFPLWCHY